MSLGTYLGQQGGLSQALVIVGFNRLVIFITYGMRYFAMEAVSLVYTFAREGSSSTMWLQVDIGCCLYEAFFGRCHKKWSIFFREQKNEKSRRTTATVNPFWKCKSEQDPTKISSFTFILSQHSLAHEGRECSAFKQIEQRKYVLTKKTECILTEQN